VTSGLIDGRVEGLERPHRRAYPLVPSADQPRFRLHAAGIRSNIGLAEQPRRQPGGRCRVRRDGGADDAATGTLQRNSPTTTRACKPGVGQSRPAPRDRNLDGAVVIWKSSTGRPLRTLAAHDAPSRASPSARTLTPRDSGRRHNRETLGPPHRERDAHAHRPHLCPHRRRVQPPTERASRPQR